MNTSRNSFISVLFTLTFLVCAGAPPCLFGQTRLTAGVKTWYAKWNIPLQGAEGGLQSDFSFALLAGPYLNLRHGNFGGTLMYMRTILPFRASGSNPGYFEFGYNTHVHTVREDYNLYLNYAMLPELTVFVNGKLMTYRTMLRWRWINGATAMANEQLTVSGFGGGVQIAIPFSGGSSFYTFISTGAVYNIMSSDQDKPTLTELLYFFDSGIGYRFVPSTLGATFGIRAEAGYQTNVIMGPTANVFYSF